MLKKEFLLRMQEMLGLEYEDFLKSYNEKPTKALRVNISKIDTDNFEKIFPYNISKIPYASNSYYLNEEVKLGNHPYHHLGLFYLQEPSAMIPVNSLEIKSDYKVLDLCAAPGGKSSQIAEKLTDGLLIANEIIPSRVKKLYSNIERQCFNNVIITNNTPLELSKIYPNYFDLVLVDAPCSGEGMFRKDQEAINDWSINYVKSCAKRQLEILNYASVCVKDNGYLLYSTCTFSKEEDEELVNKFLENNNFELIELDSKVIDYTKETSDLKTRKFFPHLGKGEGQFIALLQKKTKEEKTPKFEYRKNELSQNDLKIIEEFIKDNLVDTNFTLKKYGNNIYISDIDIDKRIKLVSNKVLMGEIIKNRFIPSHQFIMTYGNLFKNKINFDITSKEIEQYLKGEEIDYKTDIKGYAVIMLENNPLGLVKVVDNKLKNHYPKGLRNL